MVESYAVRRQPEADSATRGERARARAGGYELLLCGVDTLAIQAPEVDALGWDFRRTSTPNAGSCSTGITRTTHPLAAERSTGRSEKPTGRPKRRARLHRSLAREGRRGMQAFAYDGSSPRGFGGDLDSQTSRSTAGNATTMARFGTSDQRSRHGRQIGPGPAGGAAGRERYRNGGLVRMPHRDDGDRVHRVLAGLPGSAPSGRPGCHRR